jgi:proline iminopeptidase
MSVRTSLPTADRISLFPPIEPYRTHRMKVSDIHEIYFEESGNPKGKPVIFVHGGPGGGTSPNMRRYHDPKAYRIILFDQRGCGQSTPHAELRENTTWDLVADMERIREHLGIQTWQVFGGSWGSTLGLAYAETHPTRVSELVLRGIFLLRRKELRWFYQTGADAIFPEIFAPYREHIPAAERRDLIKAYHKRLTDPDIAVQTAAAKLWAGWEGSVLSLLPDETRAAAFAEDHYARAFARIECHYFMNKGFFRNENQLLTDAVKLKGITGTIVHGRYDMCTPIFNAFDLHARWPEAEFVIVADAGHAVAEPGLAHELITATERYKTR